MTRSNVIPKLRLGTRGSRLALAQAESVRALIQREHPDVEVDIVTIRTSGDRGERERLGAFVREIQESLLADQVDVALHCLKDLPTETVPGLRLSAHLERCDPRDAFISRGFTIASLPAHSVVGTGSVRRTSQLAAHRGDLSYKPLVGNVDTRLRKLLDGEYNAIVLAIAGLTRLGIMKNWESSEFGELTVLPIDATDMLPAPGQAVLVLETRQSDDLTHGIVSDFNHPATEICATAERTFLAQLGGGCSVPIAALAVPKGGEFELTGLVSNSDGTTSLFDSVVAPGPALSGAAMQLAQRLKEQGAMELFEPTIYPRRGEVL